MEDSKVYVTSIAQYRQPHQILNATQSWLQLLEGAGEPDLYPDTASQLRRTWTKSLYRSSYNPPLSTGSLLHHVLGRLRTKLRETEFPQERYITFHIPKASGGLRRIDAPCEELKNFQREVTKLFTEVLKTLPHDAAYAYVQHRSVKDALHFHQKNQSRWFLKLDVKDFFNNCTKELVLEKLKTLHPFAAMTGDQEQVLATIIETCCKDGALPQGAPTSPLLTNLIMIPFDYTMTNVAYSKGLRYTRYADDILISGRCTFDWVDIQRKTEEIFTSLGYPFEIKRSKTRYGSSAGSNWNLGLMLNKDNQITIGHKQKMRLRAGVNNFLRDFTSGTFWSIIDVQTLQGQISYLKSIEEGYGRYIVRELEQKYSQNFKAACKECINR